MAKQIADLTYELLKRVHGRLDRMDEKLDELKSEVQAVRGTIISVQQDVHNIYGILARHDMPLERIEKRLDLTDAPLP